MLAFGSFLAAALPLVIGLFAVAGTFAELAVLGHFTSVSIYAIDLTTALGLGLGVDYSLLMVNRFREERRGGTDLRRARGAAPLPARSSRETGWVCWWSLPGQWHHAWAGRGTASDSSEAPR